MVSVWFATTDSRHRFEFQAPSTQHKQLQEKAIMGPLFTATSSVQLRIRKRQRTACQEAYVLQGVLQLHHHKPPILHRDLTSPNLLVDKHWRVKVTDFNLSSMLRSGNDQQILDCSVANNPRWLAPEASK